MSNTHNALIHAKQDGTGEEVANNKTGGGDGSLYAPVTSIATPENGDTSSKAYAVGEMFIRGVKLCTCIVAISSGDTLVKDTNYKEGSVGEVLTELNSNKLKWINISRTTSASGKIDLRDVLTTSDVIVSISACYGGSATPYPVIAIPYAYANQAGVYRKYTGGCHVMKTDTGDAVSNTEVNLTVYYTTIGD